MSCEITALPTTLLLLLLLLILLHQPGGGLAWSTALRRVQPNFLGRVVRLHAELSDVDSDRDSDGGVVDVWTKAAGDDDEWVSQSAWNDVWESSDELDLSDGEEEDDEEDEAANAALVSLLLTDPELDYIESDIKIDELKANRPELTDAQIALIAPGAAAAVAAAAAAAATDAQAAADAQAEEKEQEQEQEQEAPVDDTESDTSASEEEGLLDVVGAASADEDRYLSDAKLGEVDSHELVELDAKGEPYYEKFVYVDEHACIGCTCCAGVAPATFFMEDLHGRARVFQQQGDAQSVIREAIETCPVDCIHYVPWEELVGLEEQRRGQVINNAARLVNQQEGRGGAVSSLVGGQYRSAAPLDISGNRGMRCGNCPSNGCKNCPMYGVGANPEYKRKRTEMRKKRAARAAAESEGGDTAPATTADL
jgi:ferredoxin